MGAGQNRGWPPCRTEGAASNRLGDVKVTFETVLVADDHAVVRGALRLALNAHRDLEVVAEAGDGAEAIEHAMAGDIDLASST